MKKHAINSPMETGKPNNLLPKGIMFPETDDTTGLVELESQKKAVSGLIWARNKRKPLHPTFEKYLPLLIRKVYYDFSVGGYLLVFVLTFGAIIGLGVVGAAIIRR